MVDILDLMNRIFYLEAENTQLGEENDNLLLDNAYLSARLKKEMEDKANDNKTQSAER